MSPALTVATPPPPGSPHPLCPSAMSYSAMASTSPIPNLYLTPPTFSLYMVGLVLEHLREAGGVATAERRAALRSGWLYEVIDSSRGFYQNSVEPSSRSRMSVPFTLAPGARSPEELAALEQTFLAEAEAAGFTHLRGHPLAGELPPTPPTPLLSTPKHAHTHTATATSPVPRPTTGHPATHVACPGQRTDGA